MGRVGAATTTDQLLLKPCTDFLPSPLDDGGKGDSWYVFLGVYSCGSTQGCDTHLGQPEQQVQLRRMMVAVLTHISWGLPYPEISPCSQEHPHRLRFPLPQVTVLCSQQLEDLLVLGLGQKFCNFVLRKVRGLTRGFHTALECVCISTSAWTMH